MTMGVFVQFNENPYHKTAKPVGYIVEESGCWSWIGRVNNEGYGRVWVRGFPHPLAAHRVMYERANGKIPDGVEVDHLCRNRACVNPAHLEAVTHKENMRRGTAPSSVNGRKTHCVHGHEFTLENTYRFLGTRQCKTCRRAVDQRRSGRRKKK